MLENKHSVRELSDDDIDLASESLSAEDVNGYQITTAIDLIRDHDNIPGEEVLIDIIHENKFDVLEDYSYSIAARSLDAGLEKFDQGLIDDSLASLTRGNEGLSNEEKAILATGAFYFDDDPNIKGYTEIYLTPQVRATVYENIARGIEESSHIERSSALISLSEIDKKAALEVSQDILSEEKNDIIPDLHNDEDSLRKAAEKISLTVSFQETSQIEDREDVTGILKKASFVRDVFEKSSPAQVTDALDALSEEHPRLAATLASTALEGETAPHARRVIEQYNPALLAALEKENEMKSKTTHSDSSNQ